MTYTIFRVIVVNLHDIALLFSFVLIMYCIAGVRFTFVTD